MGYRKMGTKSLFTKLGALAALLLPLMLGIACNDLAPAPTPTQNSIFLVGTIFREFYLRLGGEELLGPPISTEMSEDGKIVQYVPAGKMIYDPKAPFTRLFQFAPIESVYSVRQPEVPPPSDPRLHYRCGHIIPSEFWELFTRLGEELVGCPLSELIYNEDQNRYEQYFENLGFYMVKGTTQVRLLAYGVALCGDACAEQMHGLDIQGGADIYQIAPVFQSFVQRYGLDFTGLPKSEAYMSQDGRWEQIYGNLVLVIVSADAPDGVGLRPLSMDLRVKSSPLKNYSGDPDYFFYPVQGDLGYEIHVGFLDYLDRHGGFLVSGQPIGNLEPYKDQMYRQCFLNLCLVYDPNVPEGQRVRPDGLGLQYRQENRFPQEHEPQVVMEHRVTMQVWEAQGSVTSNQGQEIQVLVLEDSQPKAGIVPLLVITMPDGSQFLHPMPVTDANGKSAFILMPIQAPSSTVIPYQVCIIRAGGNFCVGESFVIWNNP
ncbi:MAG: hypothetical protein JXB15_07270 [Anaerolineales bacterium]|nr:hypothetical protein [Anaerolineales bacterium]